MAEKKVVSQIANLNNNEVKDFALFLDSPLFNKNKSIKFLFDAILKYLASPKKNLEFEGFVIKQMSKQNKSITHSSLHKLVSQLSNLFLQFIAYASWQKDKIKMELNYLSYFRKINDKKNFEKYYTKIKDTIDKEEKSIPQYINLYNLEKEKAAFESTINDLKKSDLNFTNKNDALEKLYVAEKLKTSIGLLGRKGIVPIEFGDLKIDELLNILNSEKLLNDSFIKGLYYSIKLLQSSISEKEKYFNLLKTHLKNFATQFVNEANTCYSVLRKELSTVCSSIEEFHLAYFSIYKDQISNNTFYYEGKIFPAAIKNLVTVCIKLKEFDWIEDFLNANRHKIIPEKLTDEIYNYNFARILFFKGDYTNCQILITQLYSENISFKYSIRRLELLLYYELKEYLFLDSLINSFKTYVSRNGKKNLTEKDLKYNTNFIAYFIKLKSLKTSVNSISLELNKSLEKLNKEKFVYYKEWLLEKLEELTSF